MTNVGFVGLGMMGGRVAKRLLDARHTVIGYNRTKSKARGLLDAGMRWGETPRSVAEQSDVIFSMVTDNAALQQITEGLDGILAGLKPGKIYVEMSTVSPSLSRDLAKRVAERGARMLDAAVSGSPMMVEHGDVSFLVGGDRAVLEQVEPLLLQIGAKAVYVGKNGQGLVMKLAVNLALAVQFLPFSEGILLAEKGGIPRQQALDIWLNTVAASPGMKYRGPFILNKPKTPLFPTTLMHKDLVLALELGRELNVPLPSTALTSEFLTAASGMGWAQEDFAIVFQVLARLAGGNE